MKIVYMGTPDFAVGPLERLIATGHEIVGVYTQPDKPKNRGMVVTSSPVKQYAVTHNLPFFQPQTFKDDTSFRELEELEADLIIVVAYGKLLPKRVLGLPKYGCINVHASILPLYRGASPIQQSIIHGDAKSGVTIMQMNSGLDTGDILIIRECEIESDETAQTLHDKLMEIGANATIEAVNAIERGEISPTKQPLECPFYAPLITKQDGRIDFHKTAREIDCIARAMQPWPGTFGELNSLNIKLYGVRAEKSTHTNECGEIISCDRSLMRIACSDGIVTICELQAPGKKRISCDEYFRGHTAELKLKFN